MVAQYIHIGKQRYFRYRLTYTILLNVINNVLFGSFYFIGRVCRNLEMFAIAEAENIKAVMAKEEIFFCQYIYFIEVDIKHKDIVMKAVFFWSQPVVHYMRFI